MILPHQFEEQRHLYTTPGYYVLSTSDVVELCGICDLSQIPRHKLRMASYRGKCLHKAIERYEQGEEWQDDFPHEFQPYLDGWFKFRDEYHVSLVGRHEVPYVYLHDCGQAIGGTVDFRFIYQGYLYIGDLKSIYPLSGKALQKKLLECRLQTESYKTVTEMDEHFLTSIPEYGSIKGIRRAVVHIHPNLKGGYAFHDFQMDDSHLWDAAVRLAQAKHSVGILPSRVNVDVTEDLRASLEVCGA